MKTNSKGTVIAPIASGFPFSEMLGSMKGVKPPMGLILTLVASAIMATHVSATNVVLKVVDQDGQEIPGSLINVLSQTVNTGDATTALSGGRIVVHKGQESRPPTTARRKQP